MRAISLFSGVGGFEIGFERAGVETVLQAENDPWNLAVLARHWPDVKRVTDVRDVGCWAASAGLDRDAGRPKSDAGTCQQHPHGASRTEGVDLIYGGFPCQDVSVAGKRTGLGGDRSGLWSEFRRVLSELRPRWAVIENVPGLLSSRHGQDFGAILNQLGDLGFDVAWAVLDAQHFGVPQRRRRLFVVAGASRRACEQVLAVCEGCGGHPAPGRTTRENLAPTLDGGARGTSVELPMISYSLAASARGTGDGHGNVWNTTYITRTNQTGANGPNVWDDACQSQDSGTVPATVGYTNRGAVTGASAERLRAGSHGAIPLTGVRRLMPIECERLMGWPDGHTRWTADGREVPDSIRYRMCGNGVVSTIAEYIGHRLMWIDHGLPAKEGD